MVIVAAIILGTSAPQPTCYKQNESLQQRAILLLLLLLLHL